MRRLILVVTANLLIALAGVSHAAPQNTAIGRKVFTHDVVGREPVDQLEVFPANTDKVCFFVQLLNPGGPTKISHLWLYKGESSLDVELDVEAGPSWRTWSCKQLRPEQTGKWVVEVRDADDHVMDSGSFTVSP